MFWRFGGYANISTIDTILDKDHFELEDLLDESDLIQELKQHNAKLVEYLRDQNVLAKLLEYVVAPKLEVVATPDDEEDDDDEEGKGKGIALPFARPGGPSRATDAANNEEANEKKRNRYAFVAAELLSSDNWSIHEALMESRPLLRNFWQFLKRPTPLDPLQASYFTKVNETLFDKKTPEMLDLLKSLPGAVPDMLKHVDCPMIMDLLLRIISLERTDHGQGIVEWLYTQDVMPTLLSFLGPEHSWATQTSAGDFLKAIITVSANASQNEQTCIGPNELTRQLVSKPCVEQLIKYMLGGGNPLTCGVGIVIEVIRKNNSDYDPDGAEPNSAPSSRDPIYLGTLLRLFAQHIPDFMNLIMNAPAQKDRLVSTFGTKIEPLGFDRFKTCELMAELLHCSNMGLLNEVGSEELICARDAQRQHLRAQGRLLSLRGEEAPSATEELTMRISQSSPVNEGRKLEVTNSSVDDDGFEEVTHAPEDDNSHGVEVLPEVLPQITASSFLDKDEDDFVDEPLSSPRLHVREIEGEKDEDEARFEDQELVVRPLSPNKKSNVEAGSVGKEYGEKQPEQENHLESSSQTETPLPLSATTNPEQTPAPLATVAGEVKTSASEEMSPHPDDTPAPLFASQIAPTGPASSLSMDATQGSGPEAAQTPTKPDAAEPETSEVSIIVGHISDPPTPIDDSPIIPKPVVGDYLKMQFVEYRVVPTILSFFFTYPWNNFLHNVVYDIVQQVFNGPMTLGYNPTLAISLFEDADVTNQIINGQLASEKSQTLHKTRMGYMGHLTLIAEEVVKFTERHPPELLSETVLEKVMAQDWISYVEGALAETRERDNAILGGVRPEVAMSNRANASGLAAAGLGSLGLGGAGGSSALADAGLNGGQDASNNSSGGIGPFAISAGTLMSGFGSSSDEDEDEEQENEEDVANEFRSYIDPLNANTSSMHPPSIPPPPPPPPPLNIPPSRARMQLAARLAKRNAAAAAASGGEQEGTSPPSTSDATPAFGTFSNLAANAPGSNGERSRNPFADDDDGSGSGSDDGEIGRGNSDDDDEDTGGSAWNRGSWWRNVVKTTKRANKNKGPATEGAGKDGNGVGVERFGDGRDDSDEEGDEEDEDDEIEDEEFGDFAMPEVEGGASGSGGATGGLVSGIDPAREKILLKPLPVHPNSLKTGSSPFGSLWPFSSSGSAYGSKTGEEKGEEEKDKGAEITEEPIRLDLSSGSESTVIVGEDGKKINRAVEAKRRTSIEDPDDDEPVDIGVVEESIVGRAELG